MPVDPYTLRLEAERLVGEDRVPTEELERLCREYGSDGRAHRPPARPRPLLCGAGVLAAAAGRPVDRRRVDLPAALRIDGSEAVEALFEAADDAESAKLDELVDRAGLGWRRRVEVAGSPCHHMNVGSAVCGGCGAGESEGKEESDG